MRQIETMYVKSQQLTLAFDHELHPSCPIAFCGCPTNHDVY